MGAETLGPRARPIPTATGFPSSRLREGPEVLKDFLSIPQIWDTGLRPCLDSPGSVNLKLQLKPPSPTPITPPQSFWTNEEAGEEAGSSRDTHRLDQSSLDR